MGLLNRLFGTEPQPARLPRQPAPAGGGDAYALERYRYMVQTAPPETIEQAHAEAFEKLTPEQRRQVLVDLARSAPSSERAAIEQTSPNDPRALARAATRAEVRQPGFMERTLGASPGTGFGASLLGSFAAAFAGSMVANAFFSSIGGFEGFGGEGNEPGADADAGEAGADEGGTWEGVGDADTGGDFGGGDFGGGGFDI